MEISEIKRRLTLATVIHHYNLKPDKNLRLNCSFHEDKSPSLQVYYKTHTAYCFSSNYKTHGKSLDVIDFIMYKENSIFRYQLRHLFRFQLRHYFGFNLATNSGFNLSTR